MVEFSGSLVAIVTPFKNGDVDLDTFAQLVDWQIESGTNGIVVCGTTGEAATLHFEEREALLRRAIDVTKGRVPVVYGSGTNATWSSVQFTRAAIGLGADALLAVTPYYNKPTQAGLVAHFEAMAEAAEGRPVMLYDVPGRTGVTMSVDTIKRLAMVPNITALKDATHDVARAARLAQETPLAILSGDDALTLPLMKVGAKGVVSVTANILPSQMARLCAERDEALQEKLSPLFTALFVESNPIPLKFLMAKCGRIGNELRLPLVPMGEEHEQAVLDAFRTAEAS